MTTNPPDVLGAFFSKDVLASTLCVLCHHTKHPTDPITHTLLTMLTCSTNIQLTAVGLQPFRSKDLTLPYHSMTCKQREVLLELLRDKTKWNVYEDAMTYKGALGLTKVDPLDLLESLCSTVLSSPTYADKRMRVVICNILLQRVQSSVPLDKSVQAQLNARLFGTEKPTSELV
jgi:hypothetical protein